MPALTQQMEVTMCVAVFVLPNPPWLDFEIRVVALEVLPTLMITMHIVSEKHINWVYFFRCEVYSCVMRVKSDKCTNGPMKSKVDASPLLVFNGTGGMSKATKVIYKHASLLSTVPGM